MPVSPGGWLGALLRIIDAGRLLAPAARRAAWRDQWHADLWHACQAAGNPPSGLWRVRLLRRSVGAWQHAIWLRFHQRTIEMITHDLRYGWRLMVRQPAFTLVAVLTMALGVGANVTIYSWIDALLLHPLPGVADSRRVAVLNGATRTRADLNTSWPTFVDIRAHKPASVTDLLAARLTALNVRVGSDVQRGWGTLVSANYFDVLGVRAALGRGFIPEEDRVPDAAPVVVVSDAFWRGRLGGDPAVIGSTIAINGRTFTIVGVAPPGFRGTSPGLRSDLWAPMMMQRAIVPGDRLADRGNRWLQVMVRLAPGASLKRAQAEIDVLAGNLAAEYPTTGEGRGLRLSPLWRAPGTAAVLVLPLLTLLMGMVAIVLLIACANVATLLLVRGTSRHRETAVRLALGASRRRIVQQLLTESLLLAVAGGIAGGVIAYWTSGLLHVLLPPSRLPMAADASLTAPVLVFATLVTLTTALLFGIVPALQGSTTLVLPALKESTGPVSAAPRRTLIRHVLVVTQVALSMMLLIAAGLFVRTLANAQAADVGFAMRDGLIMAVDLLPGGYDEARGAALFRELLPRLRRLPGVTAVTLTQRMPLDLGGGSDTMIAVEGYTPRPGEEVMTYYARVGSGYLETLGIGVVAGRDIGERDLADTKGIVVINDTFARRYFGGRDPIGGRVRMGSRSFEVAGVARDGKYSSITEPSAPFMYVPLQQWYRPDMMLVVKTPPGLAPAAVLPAVEREIHQIDPNLPIFDARTVEEHLTFALFAQRLAAMLLAAFGLLAVLLATVGLYGAIASTVVQRTREIGMRKALGATNADILSLVVGQGARLATIGIVVGGLSAAVLARLFERQLIGVTARDPVTFAAVTVLLLTVTLAAVFVPARRAAGFDPAHALRQE